MTEAQRAKHMTNHAAYLQHWVKALSSDSMAIFTAANDAEKMAEYVLGIERQHTAMKEHAEWVAEYEQAPEPRREFQVLSVVRDTYRATTSCNSPSYR